MLTAPDGAKGLASAGEALEQAVKSLGLTTPVRSIVIVEDPGAANFAAGLLRHLEQMGEVSLWAQGHGKTQLDKLGVDSTPIPEAFNADEFLGQHKPGIVLVGASEQFDSAAHAIVAGCKTSGIATLGFVDGPANVDMIYRGNSENRLQYAPDRVLVPTRLLHDQFERAGILPEHIFVAAHPHFQTIEALHAELEAAGQEQLKLKLYPEAGDRPVVIFLAEQYGGLDPDDFRRDASYTLHGRGDDIERTDIVIQEVIDALGTLRQRPYLVLRLHPKNHPEEFERYSEEYDCLSRGGSALEAVYAADAILGMTTILLSEALVLGKRVLSVVPRAEERDWLMHPPGKEICCVWRRKELRDELSSIPAIN